MNTNARYPVGVTIEPVPSFETSCCRLFEIPAVDVLFAITPVM